MQIKDLALTFGLKDPAASAAVDKSPEIGDGAHEAALKDGGMLSLLQDDLWHHGHGKNHFAVSAGTPEQPREIAQGERGGCWISGTGPKHTVLLAFRDLWQQFPSIVPSGVPSVFHSSRPMPGTVAAKNRVPLTLVKLETPEFWDPGERSWTRAVPSCVPSVFHSSVPVAPVRSVAVKHKGPFASVRLRTALITLGRPELAFSTAKVPLAVPSVCHRPSVNPDVKKSLSPETVSCPIVALLVSVLISKSLVATSARWMGSVSGTGQKASRSLRTQSSLPRFWATAAKKSLPSTFFKFEESKPGSKSSTKTVPAGVPSVLQSSSPRMPSEAAKKSFPPTSTKFVTKGG